MSRLLAPGEVTLEQLAQGALGELFGIEMGRVIENIADLNTSSTAKRKIVLEIEVAPAETRESAHVRFRASSKIAPTRPAESTFYIGKSSSTQRIVAVEHNPKQEQLFPSPPAPDGDKVIPLHAKTEG